MCRRILFLLWSHDRSGTRAAMRIRPTAIFGIATLLVTLAACSSSSSGSGDTSALFTASWTCSFTLDGSEDGGGGTPYQQVAVNTAANGSSLSIDAPNPGYEPAAWFCGFNYSFSGLDATLVGGPTCTSQDTVVLQSATISVSANGNELTLQETGTESYGGAAASIPPEQATFSGTCSRNP
jgi:hypothetical protein